MDNLMAHLPWSIDVLAITLAVVASGCFAWAAVLQHHVVGRATDRNSLDLAGFSRLVRHPRWLTGLSLSALGCLLHVGALILAPISVVQPIGVLAVPFAVIIAARRARRSPSRGMITGVLVSVLGVAGFVILAAPRAESSTVAGYDLVLASVLITGAVTALGLSSMAGPAWWRCVARAVAGAISFGFGSALLRTASQLVEGDLRQLLSGQVLVLLAGIALALALGGWLVQQAYAAGPAEVVVACLTVVDPLVAVLFGIALLHEAATIGVPGAAAMITCGLAAAGGVAALVGHHPDARRRIPDPVRVHPRGAAMVGRPSRKAVL